MYLQNLLYLQEATIRAEAVEKIRRDEAESHKERMRKQAELRREFLVLNARLRDSKKLEEEMNNIEVLQVHTVIIYITRVDVNGLLLNIPPGLILHI